MIDNQRHATSRSLGGGGGSRSSVNALCALDVFLPGRVPSARPVHALSQPIWMRQNMREGLCKKIARRRMVENMLASSAGPENTANRGGQDGLPACDRHEDGSTVFHRRKEDWSCSNSHTSCMFLDTGRDTTVVASDECGKLDIIRLPDYRHGCEKPRPMGTVLVDDHDALSHSIPLTSKYKLHSLQSGHAFAVGMPTGDFHVVHTERIGAVDHTPSPFIRSIASSKSYCTDSKIQRHECLPRSYCVMSPRRRYRRNEEDYKYSLPYLLKRRENLHGLDYSKFEAIRDWESPNSGGSGIGRCGSRRSPRNSDAMRNLTARGNNAAMWSFRETGSSLMASHVDQEFDCWKLRVIDDRSVRKAVICADVSSYRLDDYVTSCSFVADHYLATAHVSVKKRESVVKVWDLRMTDRSSSETKFLPSFPRDTAAAPPSDDDFRVESDHFVTAIDGGKGNLGTLVVTTEALSPDGKGERSHRVLDLSTKAVCRHVRQRGSDVYAIAAGHDVMACSNSTAMDAPISMYDLHETDPAPQQTKKRDADGRRKKNKAKGDGDFEDNGYCAKFVPSLTDRFGLQNTLSCLAMNESGTSLVAGSSDGGLFVWRGS